MTGELGSPLAMLGEVVLGLADSEAGGGGGPPPLPPGTFAPPVGTIRFTAEEPELIVMGGSIVFTLLEAVQIRFASPADPRLTNQVFITLPKHPRVHYNPRASELDANRDRKHQQVVSEILNSLLRQGRIQEVDTAVFDLGVEIDPNLVDITKPQIMTVGQALDRIFAWIMTQDPNGA